MKDLIIVNGNEKDVSQVTDKVGDGYRVSSVSLFDVNNMALSTVITMANTLDSMDVYSGGKSLRVAVCARDIAKNLGWDDDECQNIYFVALLHDIGMIAIPDEIVHKPERLSEEEMDKVKMHPQKGAEMLRDIRILPNLSDGVLYHHERWDGNGYPEGRSQDAIPKVARVIAVADAYDAMNSDRVYRSRLPQDKIISEFSRCSGSQFDPEIVDVFVFMLKGGYSVEPGIVQTREASERATREGGFINTFKNITSSEDISEGERDALTGLFTRSYLNTRVGNKISDERSGALMIIDVSGFDAIRQKDGDKVADELFKKYSDRLKSFFREADVVCRVSKDMFAVFVSGESGKGVIEKKASMIVSMTNEYEEFSGYRDRFVTSIGISMCMEDGITFEELYGVAQSAHEEAQSAGVSTYRFRDIH